MTSANERNAESNIAEVERILKDVADSAGRLSTDQAMADLTYSSVLAAVALTQAVLAVNETLKAMMPAGTEINRG